MRVLLDTNIVLDYLGANEGFTEDAKRVFALAAERKDIVLVSSSAITDVVDAAAALKTSSNALPVAVAAIAAAVVAGAYWLRRRG